MEASEDWYTFCMLGAEGVGRNSIARKVATNAFLDNSEGFHGTFTPSPNCSSSFEVISKGGVRPMERYPSHIRMLDCIFFVYAVTSKISLEDLTKFKTELEHIDSQSSRILLGNKTDVLEEREVSFEEGQKVAEALGCTEFYEVSAKMDSQEDFLQIFQKAMSMTREMQDKLVSKITAPETPIVVTQNKPNWSCILS